MTRVLELKAHERNLSMVKSRQPCYLIADTNQFFTPKHSIDYFKFISISVVHISEHILFNQEIYMF